VSKGQFLTNFPKLSVMIGQHIHLLPFRNLFISLGSSFPTEIGLNPGVVRGLLGLKSVNRENMILVLFKLSKLRITHFAFNNSKVVLTFLKIAMSPECSELISTVAFQTVECIRKLSPDPSLFDAILKKQAEYFDFANRPLAPSTYVALRLFKVFIPSFVLEILKDPTNIDLTLSVMISLEHASDEELISLVEREDIPTKLAAAVERCKSNGFLTKFAIFLDSKKRQSEYLRTPEWEAFIASQLTKIEMMTQSLEKISYLKSRQKDKTVWQETVFVDETYLPVVEELGKNRNAKEADDGDLKAESVASVDDEEFESDSLSDSDDELVLDELPLDELRFGTVLLGIFGPISEIRQSDEENFDSGSSDDEFTIELSPIVERLKKKPTYRYYGTFASTRGKFGAWIPVKKKEKCVNEVRCLPQLHD
jgi:hypothetical protein